MIGLGFAIGYVSADLYRKAYKQGRLRTVTRWIKRATEGRGMRPQDVAAYHSFLDSLPTTERGE